MNGHSLEPTAEPPRAGAARTLTEQRWRAADPCRPSPLAQPGGVQVWHQRLVADADVIDAHLSSDERTRAQRFVSAPARARFIAGRHLLRSVLGGHLGCDPRALTITLSPAGKPRLATGALHFNLSHSGEHLLLAVARSAVGVDIERIDPQLPAAWRRRLPWDAAIVPIIDERDVFACHFFSAWTRSEALIKASGRGFSVGLPPAVQRAAWRIATADSVGTERVSLERVSREAEGTAAGLTLTLLDLSLPNSAAALAWDGTGPVECYRAAWFR